jgi:hypothetical protein
MSSFMTRIPADDRYGQAVYHEVAAHQPIFDTTAT